LAIASPIPRAAPVINATFPCKRFIRSLLVQPVPIMARSAVSFRLREATPGDLERLLPLVRELWTHEQMVWDDARTPAALARLLGDETLGRVWICEEAGRVVAYLALCFGYSLEFFGRDAFVDELYTDPALRDRGIGERLLAHAEAACPALGVRALLLEVDHVNARAKGLYARSGFREHARYLMTKLVPG
jgi:ribosomal protein S18 acetylase RimI-like enzyme